MAPLMTNTTALREELRDRRVRLRSTSDTEVIAALIAHHESGDLMTKHPPQRQDEKQREEEKVTSGDEEHEGREHQPVQREPHHRACFDRTRCAFCAFSGCW